MPTWRVDSANAAEWAPGTVYASGARVVCRPAYATTARRALVYECTTAGTSHGTTEPTWPTSGTVNDNDIVWTTREPTDGTWANASCYLRYILTMAAAGDIILIDDGSAESHTITAGLSLVCAGTVGSPVKIYCVDKADDSLSAGASMAFVSTQILYLSGHFYSYGVTIKQGYNLYFGYASDTNITLESDGNHTVIELTYTGGNNYFYYGSVNYISGITIINGDIAFARVGHYINCDSIRFTWKGGKFVSTGDMGCTALIQGSSSVRIMSFKDVDFSQIGKAGVATSLVKVDSADAMNNIVFSRCKLPSDANFTPTIGSWQAHCQGKILFHHCASDNKYYAFEEHSYQGICSNENVIVRTGGASDGTTGQAIKMVSAASCVDGMPGFALESPPITIWNTATTEKTFTIEVIHDSETALQNDEIWMELEYPANNTDGLGAVETSRLIPLGSPADIADSSETWTTTGLANPNTRKLSVTATAGKAAPVTARVYLAKPSTTVYVDPKITVS